MNPAYRSRRYFRAGCAGVCMLAVGILAQEPGPREGKPATLKLVIVDEGTGKPTPVRVELLDEHGQPHVAEDALLIGGDLKDREVPWKGTLEQALAELSRRTTNANTGTVQWYSGGQSQLSLVPGTYRLKVYKGLEYKVHSQEVRVAVGEPANLKVALSRWSNLPKQGWYSADSHLHIKRPYKELNPHISKWMQAEDVHVANLLQWGLSKRFHNAQQYAHGSQGLYHEGDYWLATGQENPRTHFLGHTMILGAQEPIDFRDNYLVYKLFWEEARKQKALSGFCHYGTMMSGQDGLAIDLLDDLLHFIEVLQFDRGIYDAWYDVLNTGFRLAPIAGSDYPIALPGRERFYTRVEGPLTYTSWLEGVRRGRTFVTNGPLLEFRVNGKEVGDEIALKQAGPVTVDARVRFDPARDEVTHLEVVENGTVIRRFERTGQSDEIRARFEHHVVEASWLALRTVGSKLGEVASRWSKDKRPAGSLAHSAAIYVTLENAPPIAASRRAKTLAQMWSGRLAVLEKKLAPENLPSLARWPGSLDGVDVDDLRKHSEALRQRVQSAKKRFQELAR